MGKDCRVLYLQELWNGRPYLSLVLQGYQAPQVPTFTYIYFNTVEAILTLKYYEHSLESINTGSLQPIRKMTVKFCIFCINA